ncbi:MAG: CotH kinase family protein [Lachnospiraceae bacterium]|nr:CotH kinase family protein [Lachnospiraceae bacterium]
MKYKKIGLIACAVILAAAFIGPTIGTAESNRVHQHQEEQEAEACTHGDEVFCTHLPLVMIDTGGVEIPGKMFYDEETGSTEIQMAEDGSKVILSEIRIIDQEEKNNHMEDAAEIESLAEIRVRGNSSRFFDKNNYRIHFVDEEGVNRDVEVMGMSAHHEWALHGPILDKTLIRNYMWYNIAGEIMDWAPNVRFCEVILNGEYKGLYVMMETITDGGDEGRLDIEDTVKGMTASGYVLRLDRGSSVAVKNIETFTQSAGRNQGSLNIEFPNTGDLTEEVIRAIEQDFSDFEKALYSYDYDTDDYGYWNYIDVGSWVDYFIINEFTCNYDAGSISTYIYKDISGKYKTCIWDFNSACDNYQEAGISREGFRLQYGVWYFMLMKDEYFCERIISRYQELRETWLNEDYLLGYIDSVIAYLGDAVERNNEVWGYTYEEEYNMLSPEERNPHSYEEAVEDMKEFIVERGAWMDQYIEILLQYSHESKVKKYNH